MFDTLELGMSVQIECIDNSTIDGVVDFIDGENGYASICVSRGPHRSQDVKVVIRNSDEYKIINKDIK
jgi:hypothetical protein